MLCYDDPLLLRTDEIDGKGFGGDADLCDNASQIWIDVFSERCYFQKCVKPNRFHFWGSESSNVVGVFSGVTVTAGSFIVKPMHLKGYDYA